MKNYVIQNKDGQFIALDTNGPLFSPDGVGYRVQPHEGGGAFSAMAESQVWDVIALLKLDDCEAVPSSLQKAA